MSIRGNESVVIHRSGKPKLGGDPGPAEPDRAVGGCIIFPTQGIEDETPRQDIITSRLTVVFPPGTDVRATDEITARGTRHEVDGPPQDYRSKAGRPRALLINIIAVA